MSYRYYPYSYNICHHVYNNGGCSFCGFHLMKSCVSPVPLSAEQMIRHFNKFVNDRKNYGDILKAGKILVETNGSWFVEIPRRLRQHIYRFVESNGLELHTQCRATVVNAKKLGSELEIMIRARHHGAFDDYDANLLETRVEEILEALHTELKPYMQIFTGLEVADDADLALVNKGCELKDYVAFAEFLHSYGAQVGANVLIAPPLILDPIRKALRTAKFAFEVMEAKEVAFCCCIPRMGSVGHALWRQGKWNPASTTECSEIFRQTKARYPEKIVSVYFARIHDFHGKYTGPKIRTKSQKAEVRERVRQIAGEILA